MAIPIKKHVMIVDAHYYEEISQELFENACAVLDEAGFTCDRIMVPGALEIPAAIAMTNTFKAAIYDAYIALGCVIRGETSHYEIVANESARALMDLTIRDNLVVGNGILTVENIDQAKVRAARDQKNKGGEAARAALRMLKIKTKLFE